MESGFGSTGNYKQEIGPDEIMRCEICGDQMFKVLDEDMGQTWECKCGNNTDILFHKENTVDRI